MDIVVGGREDAQEEEDADGSATAGARAGRDGAALPRRTGPPAAPAKAWLPSPADEPVYRIGRHKQTIAGTLAAGFASTERYGARLNTLAAAAPAARAVALERCVEMDRGADDVGRALTLRYRLARPRNAAAGVDGGCGSGPLRRGVSFRGRGVVEARVAAGELRGWVAAVVVAQESAKPSRPASAATAGSPTRRNLAAAALGPVEFRSPLLGSAPDPVGYNGCEVPESQSQKAAESVADLYGTGDSTSLERSFQRLASPNGIRSEEALQETKAVLVEADEAVERAWVEAERRALYMQWGHDGTHGREDNHQTESALPSSADPENPDKDFTNPWNGFSQETSNVATNTGPKEAHKDVDLQGSRTPGKSLVGSVDTSLPVTGLARKASAVSSGPEGSVSTSERKLATGSLEPELDGSGSLLAQVSASEAIELRQVTADGDLPTSEHAPTEPFQVDAAADAPKPLEPNVSGPATTYSSGSVAGGSVSNMLQYLGQGMQATDGTNDVSWSSVDGNTDVTDSLGDMRPPEEPEFVGPPAELSSVGDSCRVLSQADEPPNNMRFEEKHSERGVNSSDAIAGSAQPPVSVLVSTPKVSAATSFEPLPSAWDNARSATSGLKAKIGSGSSSNRAVFAPATPAGNRDGSAASLAAVIPDRNLSASASSIKMTEDRRSIEVKSTTVYGAMSSSLCRLESQKDEKSTILPSRSDSGRRVSRDRDTAEPNQIQPTLLPGAVSVASSAHSVKKAASLPSTREEHGSIKQLTDLRRECDSRSSSARSSGRLLAQTNLAPAPAMEKFRPPSLADVSGNKVPRVDDEMPVELQIASQPAPIEGESSRSALVAAIKGGWEADDEPVVIPTAGAARVAASAEHGESSVSLSQKVTGDNTQARLPDDPLHPSASPISTKKPVVASFSQNKMAVEDTSNNASFPQDKEFAVSNDLPSNKVWTDVEPPKAETPKLSTTSSGIVVDREDAVLYSPLSHAATAPSGGQVPTEQCAKTAADVPNPAEQDELGEAAAVEYSPPAPVQDQAPERRSGQPNSSERPSEQAEPAAVQIGDGGSGSGTALNKPVNLLAEVARASAEAVGSTAPSKDSVESALATPQPSTQPATAPLVALEVAAPPVSMMSPGDKERARQAAAAAAAAASSAAMSEASGSTSTGEAAAARVRAGGIGALFKPKAGGRAGGDTETDEAEGRPAAAEAGSNV
ncbi:hypothetical protein HK405_006312, partial [Cladochytrium tenue]